MLNSYPFYINDWRRSEAVEAMTVEERGLYRELLDHCWAEGSLPADPKLLRKIARATSREFSRSWPLVSCQFVVRNSRLYCPKVDEKRPDLLCVKLSRSKAASTAVTARWAKEKDTSRIPEASAEDTSRITGVHTSSYANTSTSTSTTTTTTESANALSSVACVNGNGNGHASDAERTRWFNAEFWPNVWAKIDVGHARKAWLARIPDRQTADKAIAAAKEQGPILLGEAVARGGSCVYPATWLNGERWNDERTAVTIARLAPKAASKHEQAMTLFDQRMQEEYAKNHKV